MRELLLASLGGRQYGIWKDAILSVRDIHALHRIPLSPPRIAGIMIDDGKTVTLGDLSACIGYEASTAIDQGYIFLMAEDGRVTGFVASGELRSQPISPQFLFPLPDYLKTAVFDSCAVHEGISIPIINISELYSRELKTGKEASGFSRRIAAVQPRDISGAERIRFFTAANERYAVPATGMNEKAVKPGPITPLPDTPVYVKGVIFQDGRLMTVIDLTRIVKRQGGAADIMLIARIADAAFGLLVDRDDGTLPAEEVSIKLAPLIVQSPWLKHLAVRDGELVPLIDLAMAISPDSDAVNETPVWQRYATSSIFPDVFFRREVEVVEFSLLGMRYALPKVEVEEVVEFKPCRTIPDVVPIVIGVAEYNGEILPVVDLAMMFGRRSIAAPGWRMMLVNNGDFHALVITEAVIGERRLPLDLHRTVPIHLPHNLMYGCYPDGNEVSIILNVEAITVHFEKSLIQKFLPALSHEMRMSPAGVVYTFPEEEAGLEEKTVPAEKIGLEKQAEEQLQTPAQETSSHAEPEPVGEAATTAVPEAAEPEFEQPAEQEVAEFVELEVEEIVASAVVAEPEPIDAFDEAESSAGELNDGAAFEQEPVQQVSGQTIAPEAMTAEAESPQHIFPESAPDQEPSAEGSKARKPSTSRHKSPLEELKASSNKKRKQKVSATSVAENRPSEPTRATASAKVNQKGPETEPLAEWSRYEERPAVQRWKRSIAYGAIVVVLMVVFYFSGTSSDKPVIEKSTQETEPAKTELASVRPRQSVAETVPVKTGVDLAKEKVEQARMEADQAGAKAKADLEARAKAATGVGPKQKAKKTARQTLVLSPLSVEQAEPPGAVKETRAPLELDIPKNRPTDIDVYTVKEGDTLWSISEHFTGSPYNYPRIAGENKIADPDLIFPGQRIRLIK